MDQIADTFWIDIFKRLSLAWTKIIVGRIRTRYTLSGAQYTQDGDKILSEGEAELNALRERLQSNVDMILPID